MIQFRTIVAFSALLSLITIAQADTSDIEAKISRLLPAQMKIEAISESPMPGVYEVTAGNQNLYVHVKDNFAMIGDVYDTKRQVNLGDERKAQKMAKAIDSLDEAEMIVMGKADTERYVTVFTDIDCPYCQRFNNTIPKLNAAGMRVRYMMFPRAGLKSQSYKDAVSVWCADDQEAAMNVAKAGGKVEAKTCENPIAQQYLLGQKIGVRGTPTMVLDSGQLIPGFVPADKLLAQAGLKPAAN